MFFLEICGDHVDYEWTVFKGLVVKMVGNSLGENDSSQNILWG